MTDQITANQRAVLDKYGFTARMANGLWYVNDEVAYKKNALKDASKKGRYHAKTLDEALKQAVTVRKELNGELPEPDEEAGGDAAMANATAPAKKGAKGAKASASKKSAVSKNGGAPNAKKEPKARKENRYLRMAQVVASDLSLVPPAVGKEHKHFQKALADKVGGLSEASAGHFFEAWLNITRVLTEKGWLKLPEVKKPKKAAAQ